MVLVPEPLPFSYSPPSLCDRRLESRCQWPSTQLLEKFEVTETTFCLSHLFLPETQGRTILRILYFSICLSSNRVNLIASQSLFRSVINVHHFCLKQVIIDNVISSLWSHIRTFSFLTLPLTGPVDSND